MSENQDGLICIHCGSILASYQTLRVHQKTSRKCLTKQGIRVSEALPDRRCKFCPKVFTSSLNRDLHQVKCPKKLERECEELKNKVNVLTLQLAESEKEIVRLQAHVEVYQGDRKVLNRLAERPQSISQTNTNNNNIVLYPVFPHSLEDIQRIVEEKISIDTFPKDIEGVAFFATEHVLTNSQGEALVHITDSKRGNVRYSLPTGEVVVDNGLNGLMDKIVTPMKNKVEPMAKSEARARILCGPAMTATFILRNISNGEEDRAKCRREIVKQVAARKPASCPEEVKKMLHEQRQK